MNFDSIIAQAPVAIAILRGPEHVFEFCNPRYIEIAGPRKLIGLTVREAFPELAGQGLYEAFDRVYQTGIAFAAKERIVPLDRKRNGIAEDVFLDFTYQPYHDEHGKIQGVMIVVVEVGERVQAKREIIHERGRLENLFLQAPIPICILEGAEHRYVLINPSYSQLIFQGRDVMGKVIREALPELEGQGIYELLDHVYESGEPYYGNEIPLQILHEGALTEIYFNFVYQPMLDEQQKVTGIMVVVVDVSAQVKSKKLSQESGLRFKQLADSMPQIVWTSAPDGILDYTNRRWIAYSGSTTPSEWGSFVHPADLEKAYEAWMHSVQTGEDYSIEFRLRRIDGTYRWHLTRAVAALDADGNIFTWFGTCTDIEEQKQVQAELVQTTLQLKESESALKEAKNQAEMANQLKTAFLANMSHEIRTPLGAILGFTEILKNGFSDSRERNQYLDVISKNGKALTRIIDDILDLSKVEAGRMEIETIAFSFKGLVAEIVSLFSDTAKAKKINLTVFESEFVPEFIVSDPTRLRQILINILGNAIKFTQNGEVKLVINAEPLDAGTRILIRVIDSGVGLTEEQAKRLFQPFSQADNSTTRKYGGTGLGLALSKRLAKALDGDVTLEKYEVNVGCEFLIEIQAERVSVSRNEFDEGNQKLSALNDIIRGSSVLAVDDSSDNLDMLEIVLTQKGIKVDRAEHGEAAVMMALSKNYDLILMDIQMPGIDGHEAVSILRSRGYEKPIIALTAHAMNEERDRAIASGFNDHVSKPIHFETMLKTMEKYLLRRHTQ